jgi:hypothetical protein
MNKPGASPDDAAGQKPLKPSVAMKPAPPTEPKPLKPSVAMKPAGKKSIAATMATKYGAAAAMGPSQPKPAPRANRPNGPPLSVLLRDFF